MGTSPFRSWDFDSKGALWQSFVAGCLLPPWDIYLALRVGKGLTDAHSFEALLCTDRDLGDRYAPKCMHIPY